MRTPSMSKSIATMEQLHINYEGMDKPTVLGRDLHSVLEIGTPYARWFAQMCDCGYQEGVDYWTVSSDTSDNGLDHRFTLDAAKEICALQHSARGKWYRQYLLEAEKHWNNPDALVARALQISNQKLMAAEMFNKELSTRIEEMEPKVAYYETVLKAEGLMTINAIAKDYGKTAQWLNAFLYDRRIQYKQGRLWLLYDRYAQKGYMKSVTVPTNSFTKDGKRCVAVHGYWTQIGRLFIYGVLKANGILPLTEDKESVNWYDIADRLLASVD